MITIKVNKDGSEKLAEFKYRVGDYCGYSDIKMYTPGYMGTYGDNYILDLGKQVAYVTKQGKIVKIVK